MGMSRKRSGFQVRAVKALGGYGRVVCHENGWVSVYVDPDLTPVVRRAVKRMGDGVVESVKGTWVGFVWVAIRPMYW